jgi:hypothetical protein
MSIDWKDSLSEAEERRGTDAIQKAADEKAKNEKQKAEDKMWSDVAESLYVGSFVDDKNIDWVLSMLREKQYSITKN